METSLHRQLKEWYAGDQGQIELPLEGFRIDVVRDGILVEIQHGSLASIRDKVCQLLQRHSVLVVKPIVAVKKLVQMDARRGRVLRRRKSPKQGCLLDAFEDLIYFTQIFPHKRLSLELIRVEIEEWRYPGHGRRRRHRANDYQIEDQRLVEVLDVHRFRTAEDFQKLVPTHLPKPFHTGHLAERMQIDRCMAQRIAYCLRNMGTVRQVGKQGNTRLYEFASRSRAA